MVNQTTIKKGIPAVVLPRLLQVILLFLILILLTPSLSAFPGDPQLRIDRRVQAETGKVLFLLQRLHFRGNLPPDPEFRKSVKRDFLSMLDPGGLYFLKGDINELMEVPLYLDSHSAMNPFFAAAVFRHRTRLLQAKERIRQILGEPMDFALRDTLKRTTRGEPVYSEGSEDLANRWRSYLKYRLLTRLFFSELPESKERFLSLLKERAPSLLKKVGRREMQEIDSLLNHSEGYEEHLASLYLKSLVGQFDPHSGYFTREEFMEFMEALSTKARSFGLSFEQELWGEIRISHLVPGGPAWRSGRLNEGDTLLAVRFPDENGKSVNALDLAPSELESVLKGNRSKKIELTVRKADGSRVTVTLYRQKMEVEQNNVSSFVLKGERKIGYIYLPAFYTDTESSEGMGCANDMARAVLKLKRERVEGLILDLRNNGGGSLKEALALSGIFVDRGPLFLEEKGDGSMEIHKDPNRGLIYDGPLVVMVNGQSASASEFFVSAMRDYNRALIVGSPTFGKATSQIFLPLNREGESMVKVTTSLYYNLSGKSHQFRGHIPDIMLPDLSGLGPREENLPHSIPSRSIDREISHRAMAKVDFESLRKRSRSRVKGDEGFRRIARLVRSLKGFMKKRKVSLRASNFYERAAKFRNIFEEYRKNEEGASPLYSVESDAFNTELEKVDPYHREMNEMRRKDLGEDLYIEESFRIMTDYLSQFSKKEKGR